MLIPDGLGELSTVISDFIVLPYTFGLFDTVGRKNPERLILQIVNPECIIEQILNAPCKTGYVIVITLVKCLAPSWCWHTKFVSPCVGGWAAWAQ
jgi:hypothetical protein